MHEPHIVWNNPGSATIATIKVKNNGNVASRPLLTIQGKGTITVYINNKQILSIALSNSGETIIVDSADMNATSPSGSYLNRKVTGDYDKLTFPVGINELRVTGIISKITLETYSRWI
jgi:phage-related protein